MKIEEESAGGSYREDERALVVSVPSREVRSIDQHHPLLLLIAMLATPTVWFMSAVIGAFSAALVIPFVMSVLRWGAFDGLLLSGLLGLLFTVGVFLRDQTLRNPHWKKTTAPGQTLRVSRDTLEAGEGRTVPLAKVRVIEVRNADNGTMRLVATDDEEEHELLTDLTPDEAKRAKEAIDEYGG